jgi:acyl-CoA synthetase (NDP forming)
VPPSGRGGRADFQNLREFGYPGRIALVNPRQTQVYGQPCFASLRELPEPVDHALVIVPAAAVPDVSATRRKPAPAQPPSMPP